MGKELKIKAIHYETLSPVEIVTLDGWITGIKPLDPSDSGADLLIAAPGLIDNQVNGFSGVDFSGSELTVERVVHATRSLCKEGVTTFLPTLITNSPQNLVRNFRTLAASLSDRDVARSVPGFHLEGPYLSRLDGFRGCHSEENLADPDIVQFKSYLDASGEKIVQVTLAPELPGAMELIRYCTSLGIHTAIGHSNADAAQINAACDNGARLSTHLGNGCGNMIHRHFNPLWPQLANELLTPTLIADGHHLLPEELKVFYKVKGSANLLLTSDITYLAGMPAGRYSFGGADVILTADGRLRSAEQDCLAGATLPLLRGVENMMLHTGCSLGEAINMASKNVAKIFGWNDRGELSPGKRADIILLKKHDNHLDIQQCYLAGQPIIPNS